MRSLNYRQNRETLPDYSPYETEMTSDEFDRERCMVCEQELPWYTVKEGVCTPCRREYEREV